MIGKDENPYTVKQLGWDMLTYSVRAIIFALVLVLLLIAATYALGNTALQQLKVNRALACVLAEDQHRTPEYTRQCYIVNDVAPPVIPSPPPPFSD